jgi:transposase
MFARIKKSGRYEYLQIVENKKVEGKTRQRVIATIGRMDEIKEKDQLEPLIRSLSRFSDKVLLLLSKDSVPDVDAVKIGPAMIFDRLWRELQMPQIFSELLANRKFSFNLERAVFLNVLHRLFVSGSDRNCNLWRSNHAVEGIEKIDLHHFYRAMAFLGEELKDQTGATDLTPLCTKDLIEEELFSRHRDLFTGLSLVFFDTTSIYFEGQGGNTLGERGFNKDGKPQCKQMVVGAILDDKGRPISCEMWPGNTTDVKTLLPVAKRLQERFQIQNICIVADRGMVSNQTIEEMENRDSPVNYILGARMRQVKEVRDIVMADKGEFTEVLREKIKSKNPAPLEVKEVMVEDRRYIVCQNATQAKKDAATRESIIEGLEECIKKNPKNLIGNKGYARYLKVCKDGLSVDPKKIRNDECYDGKWVLRTNIKFISAQDVALKYKELWQVEQVFRDVKSVMDTRPVYHKRDETIRGHVFCSFLALLLRKELAMRLEAAGHDFEWATIRNDLESLQRVIVEDNGRRLALRTRSHGVCGKIFKAVGVAMPQAICEI